jgi:hypothetical protein
VCRGATTPIASYRKEVGGGDGPAVGGGAARWQRHRLDHEWPAGGAGGEVNGARQVNSARQRLSDSISEAEDYIA